MCKPRAGIGGSPDRSIDCPIDGGHFSRRRREQREEEEGEEEEKEKRRGANAINSVPRYLLSPFIHSLSPFPNPISLSGTMTLLRDHQV